MKEKYIAEVERHLGMFFSMANGAEYPNIAERMYEIVQESMRTVDVREYNASQERRKVNGTPYPDMECFVDSKDWRFNRDQ